MKPKSRKRKQVKEEENENNKHGRSSEENLAENNASQENSTAPKIDYSSPKSVLSSLLNPHTLEDFFSNYWEKQPLVIKNSKEETIPNVFSKDILFEILKQHTLNFVEDINVCRYVDNMRNDLNGKGRVTVKKATELLTKMGATLQIHQPQRFVSELWKLMEKLECYFNCLVGANVYMTPCDTQGLSPHYDDVEVFVIQLEGSKEWKLYKPPVTLPREYSRDLTQEEIGEATHSFTLCPGDLLYMPRGTVHQAKTPNSCKGCSTHITISTYQKHTVGDYLMTVLPTIMEKAMNASVELRQGLPVNNSTPFQVKSDVVKELLKQLPEVMKNSETFMSHEMLQDFMRFRLPPFGIDREEMLDSTPSGKLPQLNSSIHLTHPNHVACISADENEDDGQHTYLLVYSSVMNDRSMHMMNDEDEDEQSNSTLKFPSHYSKAMEELQNSSKPICISELSLASDEDKLNFAMALWTQHLIAVS